MIDSHELRRRDSYLNKLIGFQDTEPVKVITGIRRCGKSVVLKQIYDVSPMSVALSMFKDAKLDELVNVYSKSNTTERQNVYELLYQLYPTESQRLNKIKEEQK